MMLEDVPELTKTMLTKLTNAGYETADEVLDAGKETISELKGFGDKTIDNLFDILNSYYEEETVTEDEDI